MNKTINIIFILIVNLGMIDAHGATILQVSRATDGEFSRGDQALTRLLEGMGHKVRIVSDKFDPEDLAGDIDLILITETVSSKVLNSKYRDVPIPCIVSDAHVFPGMAMTGVEEKVDYGFSKKDPGEHCVIKIVDPQHPLLAGRFSDTCEIFEVAVTFHFGVPSPDGRIIASTPHNSRGGLLFTYEKGDKMVGMTAPARRVGMFIRNHHDNAAHLTEDGEQLLKLIVNWALSN